MPESFVNLAFSAGVLAPEFLERRDLEKFQLGLRSGHNWIVDYRGGAVVRPPLEFCSFTKDNTEFVRVVPFQFNLNLANTYCLIFGDQYIRVMQNGRYITESASTATISNITASSVAVVTTSGAHGYSSGDWVYLTTAYHYLNYVPFIVRNATSTTFELEIPNLGTPLDLSHLSGAGSITGTVETIYEIVSPYVTADLREIKFDQYRDLIYITRNGYYPRELSRTADDNWTLSLVDFGGNRDAPDAPTISIGTSTAGGSVYNPDSASQDAGVLYAVTAVDTLGRESYLKDIAISETIIDITNNAGFISLNWTAVTDAVLYKVYRSLVVLKGHAITYAEQVGYLGETIAPEFNDTNIVPDFTQTPPIVDNPFADGAVISVNITAAGSGYAKDTTTISANGGTGFEGLVIVNGDGEVIGVRILNPGTGYSDGSITINGDGSGATATIKVSPVGGNNPATSALIQQRRVYAGTVNLPMTFFASRVGEPDTFDYSSQLVGDDAFELSIDSSQLTPIQDLIKSDLGVIVFTNQAVLQIRGTDDSLIGVGSSRSEPVSDEGAENVKPLRSRDTTLYVVAGSHGVNSIEPTQLRNSYQIVDRSLLSNHFFVPYNKVLNWTHAATPQSLIYAVREDGTLLIQAYKPDQNVYAWTDGSTDGKFLDVATVREGDEDVVYAVVERNSSVYIEKFRPFEERYEYNAFAVDSYIPAQTIDYTSTITASARKGKNITVTSVLGNGIFSTVSVGDYIRFGGGEMIVTAVATDFTTLTVDFIRNLKDLDPQTFEPKPSYSSWQQLEQVSSIRGYWHLEGKTTEVVVGDTYQTTATVSGGEVTLSNSMPSPQVGLSYDGDLVTLPLTLEGITLQDKKKNIKDVSVRLKGPEQLCAGTLSAGEFYDCSSEEYDDYELDQYITTKIYEVAVTSDWRDDDSIVIRKERPYRGAVLGIVTNANFGQD